MKRSTIAVFGTSVMMVLTLLWGLTPVYAQDGTILVEAQSEDVSGNGSDESTNTQSDTQLLETEAISEDNGELEVGNGNGENGLVEQGDEVDNETQVLAVTASAHVQNVGWQKATSGSEGSVMLGTTGSSLRLEAAKIQVAGGSVSYKCHVQNVGWESAWAKDGAEAGSTGRSWRLEAIRIRLSDELMSAGWSVQYRAHAQDIGWLGWAADGAEAGTTGLSKRLEAVELRVVRAGTPLPEEGKEAYRDAGLVVTAHVQNVGWQEYQSGYSLSVGTHGQSLRMEALKIMRPALDVDGDVVYSAHVQNVGWQDQRRNGAVAGSTGDSRRIEAITLDLTGGLKERFDVWYRTHVENVGWTEWACNGQMSGSEGCSLRVEAIEIKLLEKDEEAPETSGVTLVKSVSGNNKLDGVLYNVLRDKEGYSPDGLKDAYDYVSKFAFKQYPPTPTAEDDWKEWSKDAAVELYSKNKGNCYRFAALFCWLAKAKGYDASVYIGKVLSSASGYNIHSWVEIKEDGVVYMCDPDLQKFLPTHDFYMRTYEDSPAYFFDINGSPLESIKKES